jgi:hypothetical protein
MGDPRDQRPQDSTADMTSGRAPHLQLGYEDVGILHEVLVAL